MLLQLTLSSDQHHQAYHEINVLAAGSCTWSYNNDVPCITVAEWCLGQWLKRYYKQHFCMIIYLKVMLRQDKYLISSDCLQFSRHMNYDKYDITWRLTITSYVNIIYGWTNRCTETTWQFFSNNNGVKSLNDEMNWCVRSQANICHNRGSLITQIRYS